MPDLVPTALPATGSPVIDVTGENFQAEVADASHRLPVVVDFWAAWCGPCRQLGPILERLASEYGGRFRLAKVDTEAAPDLAGGFGVSSIPHVAAVRDGQIVAEFVGLRSEAELRVWLDALLPGELDTLLAEGRAAEAADPAAAETLYQRAADLDAADDRSRVALARVLLRQDRDAESRAIIDRLAARGFLEPEAEQIQSQLDLRAAAAEAGGVDVARQAVEANPHDWDAKIALADALAVSGRHREAMDLLLEVVRGDRSGHGDPARVTMVRVFDTLGAGDPLVPEYRRKLATALY